MAGHEDLGSVCSGGRYDSLATNGKRTFPGVGISIGLSRLLARVIGEELVEVSRPVPTAVLVAVTDEAHRSTSDEIADVLRARGISADVAPSAAKFGKQIKAADKRSIPFVWFPGADGEPTRSRTSAPASRSRQTPPPGSRPLTTPPPGSPSARLRPAPRPMARTAARSTQPHDL